MANNVQDDTVNVFTAAFSKILNSGLTNLRVVLEALDQHTHAGTDITSQVPDFENAPASSQTINAGTYRYVVDSYEVDSGNTLEILGMMEIG
jgi:hypothetical protein